MQKYNFNNFLLSVSIFLMQFNHRFKQVFISVANGPSCVLVSSPMSRKMKNVPATDMKEIPTKV